MNRCKECGEENRDDRDFCYNCKAQMFPHITCGKMPCVCEKKEQKKGTRGE